MLISHKHKFIFITVPKTNTHIIRELLIPFLDEPDIEQQCGLLLQKKSDFDVLTNIKQEHITAVQIKNILGDDIYELF